MRKIPRTRISDVFEVRAALEKVGIKKPEQHPEYKKYFINHSDPEKFLDIFLTIKKHFKYRTINLDDCLGSYNTGGTEGQTERIIQLSKLKNIHKTIETLANNGYHLNKAEPYNDFARKKPYISETDITLLTKITQRKKLEEFIKTLNTFNQKNIQYTAYKGLKILEISKLENLTDILNTLKEINYFNRDIAKTISVADSLKNTDLEKFRNTYNTLKKHFKYRTINLDDCWSHYDTDGTEGQIRRITQISKLKNIHKTIETLANNGYHLDKSDTYGDFSRSKQYISGTDITLLTKITQEKKLKEFIKTLDIIKDVFNKEKIKYKAGKGSKILKLSKLENLTDILNTLKEINYFKQNISETISVADSLKNTDLEKFRNTYNTLKKHFKYRTINLDDCWSHYDTDGTEGQIRRITQISKLKNIHKTIETLANNGYHLDKAETYGDFSRSKQYISKADLKLFTKISRNDILLEKYNYIVKTLNSLKYKVRERSQFMDVADLCYLEGDVCRAMGTLQGYKPKKPKWITQEDIQKIGKIAKELWEKELEHLKLEHTCLYKENNQQFIEYFSNIKTVEEKKKILEAILNCPHNNETIAEWLNNNESELVKEVGLEMI